MNSNSIDVDLDLLGAHYTRLDTAISILQSGMIRLSPAGPNLNDSAEIALIQFSESPVISPTGYPFAAHSILSNRMRESARMLCLCMTRAGIQSVAGHTLARASRDQHSDAERKPHVIGRMWAQYADNHKGVVFCFDVSILIQNIKRILLEKCPELGHGWGSYVWCAPIRYVTDAEQESSLSVSYNALPDVAAPHGSADSQQWEKWKKAMRDRHYQRLYFTKTDDWQGEQEFRCYWFDPPTMPATAIIEIPIMRALKTIVVGERVPSLLDSVWSKMATTYGAEIRYCRARTGVIATQSHR